MVMIVSDMSDKILLCEQARQDKWVFLSPSLIIFEVFDWEPKIWPLSEQYLILKTPIYAQIEILSCQGAPTR